MKEKDFIVEKMDADALADYANYLLEDMIEDTAKFVKNAQRKNIKNSEEHQEAA